MTNAPLRPFKARPCTPTGPHDRVVIVGLGISGLWTARWLIRQGTCVTVSDLKKPSDLDPVMLRELRDSGVELETGGHRKETFLGADMIVVSPGVPHGMRVLESARKKGIPVMGEMELASRFIDVPIIAVTGTNGKTTVSALIGELLKNAGKKVFVGGNIGTPLMAYVAENRESDWIVAEVSSFQLDATETFSPFISMILNISPDHLDRYPDMEAYARSKLRIYENQGPGQYVIFNDDDPRLSRVNPASGAGVLRYGWARREGLHAFLEEGTAKVGLPGRPIHTFSMDRFALPGFHNQENLLAALLVGMILEVEDRVLQETIDRFKGLPHRIEYVGEVDGVRFYNDSKATNVDAARRAIAGFDNLVVLIAGGRHKGADYGPLVREAGRRLKAAVFLGEARGLLSEAFGNTVPCRVAGSMEEAARAAFSMAGPGDVVLLAPACSSFDMFSDYRHRGDQFKAAVKGLMHG